MGPPAPESASIAAGALSALGASTCCVLPLVLVSLGVGGAWIAQLRALERFQWIFIALALGAFGYAFYRLYLRSAPCDPGVVCAAPATRRRQRIAFWATLVAAKALILAPIAGVAGGISVLLALYALSVLPVSWVGLLLIAAGIGLLVAEVFATSYGLLAVAGLTSFVFGSMMLIELVKDRTTKEPAPDETLAIIRGAFQRGVIAMRAGLFTNGIRFLPPLTITDEQLAEGLAVVEAALSEVEPGRYRGAFEVPDVPRAGMRIRFDVTEGGSRYTVEGSALTFRVYVPRAANGWRFRKG